MKIRIKFVPRENLSPFATLLILVGSLVAGLFAVSLVFLIKGANPFYAIARIFGGSFGSVYGIKETITKAIPLILLGTGLTVAFKAKFWNIGAESQLLFGAMAATWIGLNLGPTFPSFLVLPLMFIAGFVAGALWGCIPALLKVRFSINEVISTLMLNYIGAEFMQFLITGPWKGKTQFGFPYTDTLPASAIIPAIPGSRIHTLTLILAVVLAFIVFFLLYSTKFGYETRVIGENPEAAKYAGISFMRTAVMVMIISGGLAGLAGVGEAAGIHHRLGYPQAISSGYGFTAIIVAWLAKLNPLAVIVSGLFFAGILVGGDAIQISLGLPAATVHVFNGILLFFLIMGDFFMKNRLSRRETES